MHKAVLTIYCYGIVFEHNWITREKLIGSLLGRDARQLHRIVIIGRKLLTLFL